MRPVVPLILLALLLPVAAARPDLADLTEGEKGIGPCVVRWGFTWPGESLGGQCTVEGQTVAFSHGTCALGHYTYVRVGNTPLYFPCDGTLVTVSDG